MKNEQGFSLVELLIVVAIIAIIAAIAVPSLLTSRMAANESGGIQGCRTVASAEVAFASTNNQMYALMADLVAGNFLDDRFTNANGFNGYTYAEDLAVVGVSRPAFPLRYRRDSASSRLRLPVQRAIVYGIGPDQVVRYQCFVAPATVDPGGMAAWRRHRHQEVDSSRSRTGVIAIIRSRHSQQKEKARTRPRLFFFVASLFLLLPRTESRGGIIQGRFSSP